MLNSGLIPAAAGTLQLRATPQLGLFRLNAAKLTPNTQYVLTINGSAVQTLMSDKGGKLTVKALPAGSPNVTDIQSVALADGASGNVVLSSSGLGLPCTALAAAQAPVNLGAAASFAVLAGSTVANTGLSTVNGDLGVSPGSAVTGFPPGIVHGNQHVADSTAAQEAPSCRNNQLDDETGTRESEAMSNELHQTARALVAEGIRSRVVSRLAVCSSPFEACSTKSVNVPPTSKPTR